MAVDPPAPDNLLWLLCYCSNSQVRRLPSVLCSKVFIAVARLIFEMAQIVCGSCRRLLSYPRGARHVKCSCCQTVNLVLEADQVGQVKCGSCAVLLMYPYGASQVRCCSCQFVTKIEEHNKRPPWSVLQLQGKRTPSKSAS